MSDLINYDPQFIFRGCLDLEHIKVTLCELLGIEQSKFIPRLEIDEDDSEDTLYYEYFITEGEFRTYLTLDLTCPHWKKFYYKNAIIDLGVMFAKAFQQETVVAPDDPITPYINDWVLIKPEGAIYRVKEEDPESDHFNILDGELTFLSEAEVKEMKK